ncbi:TetR/AcrR family transcriptional regulator [Klebsiella oxytoca]|uniref:TetR/AcrR family transcriptional regulator n=1 Tax=Klebsiella oxytoca TaxID=571 RepID=UPI0035710384
MDRSTQILNAAIICMREKGFHNASIKNVAKCANISTGLIYRYYKNKDALIEALVINVTDKMIHLFEKDGLQHEYSPEILPGTNANTFMHDIQNDIFMLMDIAAEAFRNNRYREIMSTAHHRLRQNIINHEIKMNPDVGEKTLHTRFYFLSILIDGLIVQQSRKGHATDGDLNDLINNIAFCAKKRQY